MAEIDVPIVDLQPFLSSSSTADEKAGVVDAVRDAAERCGFLVIRGHGASEEVIDDAWSTARNFFDQPLEVKEEVPMTGDYPYGYGGMGKEKVGHDHKDGQGENDVNDQAKAEEKADTSDLKESFQICLSTADKPAKGLPEQRWPSSPAHFSVAMTNYYREMERIANVLLVIFARALDLPDNWFDDKTDSHWCALRVLNYPEPKVAPNPGQLRIAAHSDYGVLTILRADNTPGGLQVQKSDGVWSDVVIPEGCMCVNLGDLMQRWTNDRWMSTPHRVVNPPLDSSVPTRRQSMAFFHNLNKEVTVEVIPTCVPEGEAPKYGPINAFDHLMERHALAIGAKNVFKGDDSEVQGS